MLQKCQENDLDHASNPSVLGIQNSCTNFFIMASEKLCMFYAVKKDFADYWQCCQPLQFIIFGLLEFADIKISTFMSSLVGNFDHGYSTVWKFGNFYGNKILREINFGWFQMVKNCRFNNFEGFEFFTFGKISHLKVSKPKNSKFRAAQMVKMAVFRASKCKKLILCKI